MRALVFIFSLLIAFSATAFAAGAIVPEDGSILDLLKPVYEAFATGDYLYAGAVTVVVAVALAKRYAAPHVSFLQSKPGQALMVLIGSFAGAVAAAVAGPAGFSWAIAKTASMIAIGAAGGYTLVKELVIDPLLRPLAAKAPAWMQPLFALVFWIFDRPSPVAKAEAAGQAAVVAKPAEGVEGVLGKPRDVE